MPSNDHLQQFAQQLASWAKQIIENGRTPFRRVDLFHQLHTETGICHPPLIFWINRQSMIAGGLIFLPDSTTDCIFSDEAAAAASLGLRHFVTWEAEKINVWEVTTEGNVLVSTLSLNKTEDPAVFHHRLYELIDQLKLLSVTGRVSANEISPYYLLNLLEETLALSFPALLEYCRMELGDNTSGLTPEEEAQNWNRLTLLRLLSLLNWKILPDNIPMDQLTASSGKLLGQLPAPLGQTLLSLTPEPSLVLPTESAVAFHHLLLRLQQIDGQNQGNRSETTLRLLLCLWHGAVVCKLHPDNLKRLLLHSQELAPSCWREISHSGAQLAANTLIRILDKQTHPTQIQGDVFKISSSFDEKLLHANFYGDQRPTPPLRRELAGHLRNSWPNRHLSIPGHLPFWATEAAHLLGLSAQESQVELHLPSNWLHLLINSFFTELMFNNFVLESVDCREETRHLLKLSRRQGEIATEFILKDDSRRFLELGLDHTQATSKLLCALELPPQLFELLKEQQLVLLSGTGEEASHPQALTRYAQSSLGQQLWKMCTRSALPSTAEKLLLEGAELNWLVPEATYLKELAQLAAGADSKDIEGELNQQLNHLLGLPVDLPSIQVHTTNKGGGEPKHINRNLNEELLRQLEIEGIPHFPQTYLYSQATGPLSSYAFVPPLKLSQELLGQYELEDAQGHRLQVTGEETKEALLLASILGMTTLEIPIDRNQTAQMLDTYRQDLIRLQETIVRLCNQHIEQSAAAQRLYKKLWQQLPLPPAKWLSS